MRSVDRGMVWLAFGVTTLFVILVMLITFTETRGRRLDEPDHGFLWRNHPCSYYADTERGSVPARCFKDFSPEHP